MKVNFNSILENYNSEIENKLRGFNTDLDYLKYWVPSPNTVESVYNLISNFRECDIKDVTIEFNKNYLNSEQIDKILKLKENVGDIKYFVESFRKKLFTESLKSFLNNYNYIDIQNEIKIKEKLIKIKKNFLENQLIFYIENDSWILKDIKFFKKNEMDDNSNLVDKFIKVYKPVCLNLPFREVLDHSLIYFFYKYFKLEIKNTGIFHYENNG